VYAPCCTYPPVVPEPRIDPPSGTPADEVILVLFVPRAISAVLSVLGLLWATPMGVAIASGRALDVGIGLLNLLIAGGLIAFAVDTLRIRMTLTAQAITLHRWRKARRIPWSGVKGVVLRSDSGTPTLKVVTTDGTPSSPAWSLRARHPDGEVEPAGPALQRFGDDHGIRVRVRKLTDRVPG
jgi:hypothetical protein